uniref:Uncharacterized protein n=1 Tax=Oryza glaberrima TaxID=4538 RepID=I1Q9Z6_ORYGL
KGFNKSIFPSSSPTSSRQITVALENPNPSQSNMLSENLAMAKGMFGIAPAPAPSLLDLELNQTVSAPPKLGVELGYPLDFRSTSYISRAMGLFGKLDYLQEIPNHGGQGESWTFGVLNLNNEFANPQPQDEDLPPIGVPPPPPGPPQHQGPAWDDINQQQEDVGGWDN